MTAASSRIPQTPTSSAPPTRRPPSFTPAQPPPSSFTTSPKQPQLSLSAPQYSEQAGESQDWSQRPTVSASKPPRPPINTTMAGTQELCLAEKQGSAGDGNRVCKTPRGQGRGQGQRGGRRRLRPGAVRLVSADGRSDRGRVEVFVLKQWGTVCDDLFTIQAGAVVCRQLGFTRALEVKARAALGAADRGVRILLDDVECEGGERSLLECRRAKIGKHNCSHREDVGVICG